MSQIRAGTIDTRILSDGTRAFRLRFSVNGRRELLTLHERPGCGCGCGGGWDERASRTELGNVLARVRAGVWEPAPPSAELVVRACPTFIDYASQWLRHKADGVLGEKPIDANSYSDYRWRLSCHLLPFFGSYRLDEINRALCLRFKAQKLREAGELREVIARGAELRDERGRRKVPLSPASIRKLIDTLAAVLDDAIEDELIDHNPARGKRMRVRVPKPDRTFLEMDELACLLDAASAQEEPFASSTPAKRMGSTTAQVAALLERGHRPPQIATRLGLAKSTVSHHIGRLNANVGRGYAGRRAIIEILGRSGIRVSELCDLRIGQLRLHDRDGARFRIPDAKTEAGVREVQMSPDLVEAMIEHIDRMRRVGAATGPENRLIQNLRGGRISRQRVAEIVCEAGQAASARMLNEGLPPLPRVTPHSLRRTYISIALLANNFDVKWVMSQVGHANSKMTMDVYAQLEQRAKREHGASFDRLVRQARELRGEDSTAREAAELAPKRHRPQNRGVFGPLKKRASLPKNPPEQGKRRVARLGIEPRTPRFSVVCSTN
jgi:integrase